MPPVYHPLVIRHPVTGRKALYALGHGAYAIRGMPDDEGEAFLDSLKDHVIQERHIYRHKYAVGDLVVWDTLQTMHAATPIDAATSKADSRLLWRISVRGRPAVHARAA